MIDRTMAVITAVMVVLTARASADTCDQLRQDIARLTATLRSEQDALARCRQHPVGCSVSDLQAGVAQASEELAALRARVPTCTPLPPHPAPRFRTTDLSPSALYRSTSSDGSDPAGRVLTVVVDPTTPTTLYAASEFGGVWKSVDAGQTWTQASRGLTMSELAEPGGMTPVLAIDERNPRRLVLAAGHDDFRDTRHAATSLGIWVSTDGAATWSHASIVGQTSCAATRVAFAAGQGYAVTGCGIATASSDLTRWTVLAAPFTVDRNATYIAARGAQLFACDGTTVRVGAWSRAVPAPRFTWGASATLAGCQGLAAAPSTGAAVVVAIHGDASKLDVSTVQFASPPTVTSLELGGTAACCGRTGVFVAPRLADAATPYDVFASNGFQLLQYAPASGRKPATWSVLAGIHADTWSMAFPASYDPRHGNCTAYASSDGGVSASAVTTVGRLCRTADGAFQRAQRGLHVFGTTGIVGVRGPCGTPQRDCFGLYVSGPDNGTWGFRSGGSISSAWASMGCCGDSGTVTADWAAPWLVATGRNNGRTRWDGKNQPPVASSDPIALETLFPSRQFPTNPPMPDRNEPPQQATFSQLQTLTSELRANPKLPQIVNGDYFQIITVPKTTRSPGGDTVFRLSDATSWSDIAPGHPFTGRQLTAIATAGGHEHAMVFAIGDGLLWRRSADASTGDWQDASGRPRNTNPPLKTVGDVWVNPDNWKQLYVTDATDQRIRYSTDGGDSWHDDATLTSLATHGGEFQAGCFGDVFAGRRFCSLQQMLFVRDRSDFRIAILFPGGVALTRDGGQHWRSLDSFAPGALTIHALSDLIAHPYAGYLETGPGDTFSLYLAMRGRGVVRIDGSF